MPSTFDFVIFGSTSEFMQAIVRDHKPWFLEHVHELTVIQRTDAFPEVYRDFNPHSLTLDCANPQEFGRALRSLAERFAHRDRPLNIFPTYGSFSFDYADVNPVFRFQEDGFQVNLNSRLQILDAFRANRNARFHFFGSLLGSFPYLGGYATSMWYINQLPRNAEYRDLNLIIYNVGGLKTRFWDFQRRPDFTPFLHQTLPTDFVVETGFRNPENKGVFTKYPSVLSRLATWLGRRGVRPF